MSNEADSSTDLSSPEELRIPNRIPRPVNAWILCKNIKQGQKELSCGIILPQYETREDLSLVVRIGDGTLNPSTGQYLGSPYRSGDVIRTTRKKGRSIYLAVGDKGAEEHFNLYQEHETICIEYHSPTVEYRILKQLYNQAESDFPDDYQEKQDEYVARMSRLVEMIPDEDWDEGKYGEKTL